LTPGWDKEALFPKRIIQIWGSPSILCNDCDYTLFFPQK
jgi:hypothetical protein